MSNALVIGCTGLIGQSVSELLALDAHWQKVTLLARRPAERAWPAHVAWRVVDFDAPATYAALQGEPIDHVFCCLGTTMRQAKSRAAFRRVDFDYPLSVAKATAKSHQLLVSAVGANARAGSGFYMRTKGELEVALRALAPPALDIFQPSFLIGARPEHRPTEAMVSTLMTAIGGVFRGPLARYHAVKGTDVARAMLAAAKLGQAGARVHTYRDIMRLAGH